MRAKGVVGCFVECFGPGVAGLSATQRACISNMTPEYGSTCTLFPVDGQTIDFLRMTGRSDEVIDGDEGPWMYLYWTGDQSIYQEFTFVNAQGMNAFEEFCLSLKKRYGN